MLYENYYHQTFEANRAQMLQNYAMANRWHPEMYANRKLTEKDKFELKCIFNDISMREMGLDITEEDRIYYKDDQEILVINGKYLKYSEDEFPKIMHDEIEFNLLENPRLMEFVFGHYMLKYAERKHITITSNQQTIIKGSDKGNFIVTYIEDESPHAETKEIISDAYVNESVRIFSLITKINHTSHLYNNLERFDIPIIRKGK